MKAEGCGMMMLVVVTELFFQQELWSMVSRPVQAPQVTRYWILTRRAKEDDVTEVALDWEGPSG